MESASASPAAALKDAPWQTALERAVTHSQYLRRLFAARPELSETLRALWQQPLSEKTLRQTLGSGLDAAPPEMDEAAFFRALRQTRQQTLAHLALRDLSGAADLSEIMEGMTLLADVTLNAALSFCHAALARDFGEPLDQSGTPERMMVVGMGKLGGRELNVSSDVDFIFVYPEEGETSGARTIENFDFFNRLAKRLIAALAELTADGMVFRVDMRLRPNGDSGPLVSSLAALENYFITQGREWERYAWIKARIMNAGENAAGRMGFWIEQLQKTARSFVFRRYLDFGAIDAMRALHAQIRREVTRRDRSGNIKLGPGGIREIEFIAQVFQLIRGGRDPRLQIRPTLRVLEILAERCILPPDSEADLHLAYVFLRRLEHRLQYADDQQTHALPEDDAARARLAKSMDMPDWETLFAELESHRARVSAHFEAVFSGPEEGEQHPLSALWQSAEETQEEEKELTNLGFTQAKETLNRLRVFRAGGRYRQLPPANRQRLDAVAPRLIDLARHLRHPDVTLARGLDFLEEIARRGAYLALLQQYPQALEKVARIIDASSWAANYLNRHPLLLDELLDVRLLETATDWAAFRAEISRALKDAEGDTEREMDVLREMHHAQVFRLLAQDLAGLHSIERISDHLTALADILLETTLALCWQKLARRHRETPAFAIIGYGKLGGKELGYASDLDLVYISDEQDRDPDAAQYYNRLGQRVNTWLSSRTAAGQLFETDLRLRPDGDSGLLVCTLEAFLDYQMRHAWAWEHQALTRARFVAGDAALGQRFEAARQKILCQTRDLETLRQDVEAMRKKMYENHTRRSPEWFDVKQDPGGLIDVEFIVQYLVLGYAHTYPQLTANLGNIALLKMAADLDLIPRAEADAARRAYREYRRLQHEKRLNDAAQSLILTSEAAEHIAAVRALWRRLFPERAAASP
ncbi:MAG: bifunctional [glutamate--ammonia ligase]-adenylyl-L-tyrosine phosphorylase/[glutamate--ammonia-ligase] adenylyltransferase [Zoogloeaceae bacterium]|jgi:glutamate-ammonia-ligase adenylyltransferase|nr:bifunctional [glutamate--ammonia ligase]-adenylyl-L-tyrosine phosphorylase/[glutamate--ammonia-ligase] adenylyltransferase [Zoogloeaceae bacterium]